MMVAMLKEPSPASAVLLSASRTSATLRLLAPVEKAPGSSKAVVALDQGVVVGALGRRAPTSESRAGVAEDEGGVMGART
jgi:hypothetical protein